MAPFPKTSRLLSRREFDAVFALKQGASDRHLSLHWRANELGHARMGLAVSASFGNAVARNRFKRRLRELFRHSELGGLDLVAMPARHGEAKRADFARLEESWKKLLKQALQSQKKT